MIARATLGLLASAVALALGWLAVDYNLERACVLGQWPELPSCTIPTDDVTTRAMSLRKRIERNPGDSEAWINLAMIEQGAALDRATQLAPQDYRLQRLQAGRALEQQQWAQAVTWLTRLVQDNGDGPAAVALAKMVLEPHALAAMLNQLETGSRWLAPVINAMPQARVPVLKAMPLVVRALAAKELSPELVRRLMGGLKAEGQWFEAHALWMAWLGHSIPLLFNGDFEQGFIPGGFDWEVLPVLPSRAGALVRQATASAHGGVLEVDFTGKQVTVPMVRQYLVLPGNRYALRGEFMTSQLRAEHGLAWVVLCVAGGRELARTPALKETGGKWLPLALEFELPPACGPAVALQLQTFAPEDALGGLRGRAMFDNFELQGRP